jgi:hypothetical protein
MNMPHGAWTFGMEVQHGQQAWTGSMEMQHRHAAWTCSMDMQYIDMQHGHVARTCRMNMEMDMDKKMDMSTNRDTDVLHVHAACCMLHEVRYHTCTSI